MPQFPFSDQLVQVIPKVPIVFYSMSMILVILTIQALMALHGLSSHLIRPLEEWIILDFLKNLMYRFFKYSVNLLRIG